MTPAKTISFLVGIGPEARVDHYFSQCGRCWMRDCAYRRAPRRGHGASLSPDASARIGAGMDNVILVGFMGAGKSRWGGWWRAGSAAASSRPTT